MIKNRLRYIAFFLLILLFFVGFRGRTLFLTMTVLVVMPVITISQARRVIRKLAVTAQFEKDMVGRNAVNVMRLTVHNGVHLPSAGVTLTVVLANSFYKDDKEFKVDIPITGYGDNSVDIELKAENCGNIYVKSVKVESQDLLSLCSFKRSMDVPGRYMVIPAYIYAPSDKSTFKPEDDSEIVMREVGEDTSEIESIREYQPGDRMQRIHWKLTGKMEEMMVKEYAINYDIDVSLVVELNVDASHPCLDELLDALYSLMIELCDTNERYGFYFANKNHDGVMALSISSREDVLDAIGQLYYIEPYEERGLAVSYAKALGVDTVMTLRWKQDAVNQNELLYEFGDKVVLVWE